MIARLWAAFLVVVTLCTFARAESPENLYTLNCWGCHRANGEGIPGTAPPLRNAADFLRVSGGREYLIQVPGVAQSMLNDDDAAVVMNWIIENFSKGRVPADFRPYTAQEIHDARRRERLLNITGTRKALIQKMVVQKIRPDQAL